MNPSTRMISIRYGNSVLNNVDAARKLTQSQMELPRRENLNASFNSEWDDFIDDFPAAEIYLHTDFVDRVFPTFKDCVLAKEYADSESAFDASSDDGIQSPKPQGTLKDESYPVVCKVDPKNFSSKSAPTSRVP
ncbi:uncharacterized protein LOC111268164 [Varroa jacobsoni]|uniref:uncharacterized protein LOC111268164 n=1 Tax=Varroa jacobsoni TaxID=62625 RepID=UPI000BF352E0|nr:uncharacterized protein LOC111268164 [Varroa jacobsoni]